MLVRSVVAGVPVVHGSMVEARLRCLLAHRRGRPWRLQRRCRVLPWWWTVRQGGGQ